MSSTPQILSDFIVQTKTGLYCKYGNFYLDPKVPVAEAVISHAHGDHAIGGHQNVYCTLPTLHFMQYRFKPLAAVNFNVKTYKFAFVLNGVQITFFAAGHILGSALVMMEFNGVKYLYTGDYKLQEDATCEPIELVSADVLITETTFANPNTEHPNVGDEIQKLNHVSTNIILGAYALGKSQRLIQLLNQHCPNKRILVHHGIMPLNKIYEQLGINLGKYEVYDRKVMKNNPENLIYIVPPMVFNSNIKFLNVVKVFATGWKNLQNNNELQLYISDHVDWKAILKTIAVVTPKEVWTTHGSGVHLQNHFGVKLAVKLLN